MPPPSLTNPPDTELPFAGLRVLDISQGIAGPYCAHILWQQGAQVIKVEPPAGDWGRKVGVVRGDTSALALAYNGGKRSACIDATSGAGKAVLLGLARQADVVVQNFRPQVAERLGVGYAALAAQRPELVYVSISGYGPDGPYADYPASDSVMQADSGLMFANRDADGAARRIGMLLADAATGLYAAQACAAALCRRFRSGHGSHVELNLFEACCALQANNLLEHALGGPAAAGPVSAPNGVYASRDGSVTLLALNDTQFGKLCRALDHADWLDDPRFADNAGRMAHAALLDQLVASRIATRTTAQWQEILSRHDVLHAPVRSYDDVLSHPQAAHRQSFQTLAQPGLGPLPFAGIPARGMRRDAGVAPANGEHTVEILRDAGFAQPAIDDWLRQGVVRQAPAAGAGVQ
ncbi:Acyl-CoA transferase/carnitine dehydratase [Cupriavidus taiwanensis]|uniref:Acyl-CoA transferase/carnitine dehydratase n=1 Tax=Cupriavidus taiwanensis TaxID=164546 RepID=A0A975XAK3_9BURK|nr:CoA transferase [Cupriavidus taiwanensis]SOY63882.1 Acyl-CoA transferase/carnitine dehydratase [Cupriavidus taiwanensis]